MKTRILVAALPALVAIGFAATLAYSQQATERALPQWIMILSATDPSVVDGSDPEAVAAVQAHFERLQRLRDSGQVLLAGRTTDDDPMGIVIYTSPTRQSAMMFAMSDPAVAGGYMSAKVRPYRVALEGFSDRDER